jgi:hypothetical protein
MSAQKECFYNEKNVEEKGETERKSKGIKPVT